MTFEESNFPSRLQRFKKTFSPESGKLMKAWGRLIRAIPDSRPGAVGQRIRFRPLFEDEMSRVLRRRGHDGDEEVARRMRVQEASLGEWISCLHEEYSDKKFSFILEKIVSPQLLGARDSIGEQPFGRRTPETYAPYPRLNRAAFARTIDVLVKIQDEGVNSEDQLVSHLLARYAMLEQDPFSGKDGQELVRDHIRKPDFLRLYELELFLVEQAAREIAGKSFENAPSDWRDYRGEAGARKLSNDLAGTTADWCIAGYETAYHRYLSHPNSSIRVCFRGENNAGVALFEADGVIREIRGGAPGQQLDGDAARRAKEYIHEHLSEKSDIKNLDQAFDDVLMLTDIIDGAIERAVQKDDKALLKSLLDFLYEIERPIQSFGYGRDSRIDTLLSSRNIEIDMPIMFDCAPEEIARKEVPLANKYCYPAVHG